MTLEILGFEAFDGGSHRAMRESIVRRSRHRWRWLTRPPRAWKWRMRLAALEMLEELRERKPATAPDALFVTSLLSVSDLRAGLPAWCRDTPLILYMHENQAAYPVAPHADGVVERERDAHFALTNLASILSADRVVWNSAWNRDSFIAGMAKLLTHADDSTLRGWRDDVLQRSVVRWPPVEPPPRSSPIDRPLSRPSLVVWPHRWEHDKGPEELLELAERETERLDLRWVILGERFRVVPRPLLRFGERLGARIEHMGFVASRAAYWDWLARADWVLSTARHEFFGIAVVEALLSGCLPWLPDRLSYPELLPQAARGLTPAAPPDEPAAVRRAVHAHLRSAVADAAVASLDELIEAVVRS